MERRAEYNNPMLTEKQKYSKIISLGVEITQVKDLDVLLERILREARNLVNADAGTIYVKEEDKLKELSHPTFLAHASPINLFGTSL